MPINVHVDVQRDEPIDRALRRFAKKCKKENIVRETIDRMRFKTKKQKRKKRKRKG